MFLFDKIMLTITYDRNWNHQYKIKGGRRGGARWRHKSKLNSLFVSRFTFHSSWFPNPSSVENKLQKKLHRKVAQKSCTLASEMHFMHLQKRNASYAWPFDCSLDLELWISFGTWKPKCSPQFMLLKKNSPDICRNISDDSGKIWFFILCGYLVGWLVPLDILSFLEKDSTKTITKTPSLLLKQT